MLIFNKISLRKKFFLYSIYFSYILFFISIFGLLPFNLYYYNLIREVIKYFVSFFLIIKFNPFSTKNIRFDDVDKSIVFHCGIFLLITTSIIGIIEFYIKKYTNIDLSI